MGKDYIRIDDRLIHGQIVMAWCGYLKIKEIIAVDDNLASNKTLQSIMLMGIPQAYKAHVVTVEGAKEILSQRSELNRLFVTRFPQDLRNFITEIKQFETIVLGNAGKRPDTKYNLTKGGGSVFFASEEDVKLFDELEAGGNRLIYQTVPSSPLREWAELRKSVK